MAAAYDLDASEVSFVTGSGESTNKVQSIVEDARERRDEAIESHAGSAFEGARNRAGGEADDDGDSEKNGDGDDGQLTLGDSADDDSSDEPGDGDGEDATDAGGGEDEDRAEKAESDDAQSGLGDFV
jgi:replication factor C large subunit